MDQQPTYFMAWVENSGDADGYALFSTYQAAADFIHGFFPYGHHILRGDDGILGCPLLDDNGFILQGFTHHGETTPPSVFDDSMVGWVAECPVRVS